MTEFIDNLGDFIKSGNTYEIIKPIENLQIGFKFKVFGKRMGGLPYDNIFGWEIKTNQGYICLDQKRNQLVYLKPEEYLKVVGTFDLKEEMKKIAAESPETGFKKFIKKNQKLDK